LKQLHRLRADARSADGNSAPAPHAVAEALGEWLQARDYAGNDPYQLDSIISGAGGKPLIGPLLGLARRLLKPYHALIPRRLFQVSSPIVMPQALGDALSGEGILAGSDAAVRRSRRIFALLDQHRSPLSKNWAWGLPFVWGGQDKHPKHWPMTITTTLVLTGMLDAERHLDSAEVLEKVRSGIRFMLEECGVEELPEGACILYGPGDTRLIINQNAAAAGLLARVADRLGRPDLMALAERAAAFCAHHQNADGSWYFAMPHGQHALDTIIDFRHTGYILEGLLEVRRHSADAALVERLDAAIARGWAYVRQHLIEGDLPRWAPDQTWPVDSHDVAEAIILAVEMGDLALAQRHVNAALSIFYLGDGKFAYKAFHDGRRNDAVFIRWTQAPMYKALARYIQACRGAGE
jgi:hypothetical protein